MIRVLPGRKLAGPIATNNLEYKYALRPQEEVEQRVMLSYELSA